MAALVRPWCDFGATGRKGQQILVRSNDFRTYAELTRYAYSEQPEESVVFDVGVGESLFDGARLRATSD